MRTRRRLPHRLRRVRDRYPREHRDHHHGNDARRRHHRARVAGGACAPPGKHRFVPPPPASQRDVRRHREPLRSDHRRRRRRRHRHGRHTRAARADARTDLGTMITSPPGLRASSSHPIRPASTALSRAPYDRHLGHPATPEAQNRRCDIWQMRSDPSNAGGLFVGRRPGTARTRCAPAPQGAGERHEHIDGVLANTLLAAMTVISLLCRGPSRSSARGSGPRLTTRGASTSASSSHSGACSRCSRRAGGPASARSRVDTRAPWRAGEDRRGRRRAWRPRFRVLVALVNGPKDPDL
jgi:hypothetical protein